jgi:uncharacterized membrane-anchored protein
MRNLAIIVGGVLILAAANFGIYQKEQLLAHGRSVLLELAPVDPRSLMQGDYMALRFRVATDAFRGGNPESLKDGRVVLAVDDRGVGTFKRFDDGTPLGPGELAMRYRVRNQEPKFATNAFFFQEGHAEYYAGARFGEFRVSSAGDAILTALRGGKLETLGPPR